MSVSLFMLPLAVAVVASSVEGIASIVCACEKPKGGRSEKIQTKFNNEELLKKTLGEHGIPVKAASPGRIVADFGTGKILYERADAKSPYTMQVYGVKNLDDLVCNIKAIDQEYNSNVQSYVYHRLKDNLPENMQLQSEEILEDDSILVTLSVE